MLKGIAKAFYQSWLKPPTRRKAEMPLSYYHAQNQAASIGGKLFPQEHGYEQAFFWMPERELGPKLGEYVYMKYRAGEKGRVDEIVSHLHYVLTRDTLGQVSVRKYSGRLASDDTPPTYQDVSLDELRDLHTSARLLKDNLSLAWLK